MQSRQAGVIDREQRVSVRAVDLIFVGGLRAASGQHECRGEQAVLRIKACHASTDGREASADHSNRGRRARAPFSGATPAPGFP
jgi:hypothetical protein